jgi:hypothetical protein
MHKKYYILILDNTWDLKDYDLLVGKYQAVFCLFWLAPSTKTKFHELGNGCSLFSLEDIISSDMTWGKESFIIAQEIVQSGPHYNGLPIRRYLLESLYKESHLPSLLNKLIEFAERMALRATCDQVVIEGCLKDRYRDLFTRKLARMPGYSFNEIHSSSLNNNLRFSSALRSRMSKLKEIKIRGLHPMHLFERVDKTYQVRCSWGPRFPRAAISKGGVTFFSSYLNNSQILSSFTDLMPYPVTWVVTNYWGRKGIGGRQAQAFWLWQVMGNQASGYPYEDNLPLVNQEDDGADYFGLESTDTWKNWDKIESKLLMNLTRCWEAYLDEAEPRLLVLANQWGIEGWFTQLAKRRGIPVLQVLHGVLGGYLYTRTPVISDALIVPGEFWKELWPEDQREKILIYNPWNSFPVGKPSRDKRPYTLSYFSWPLSALPFYNFSALADAIIDILHNLATREDVQVQVRPHPLENPHEFLGRWRHLYGQLPKNVRYTSNDSLKATLRQTDLALMFRSTVMLNCLVQGIPVVMPGWIDYGWNASLREISGVYLADDFSDLNEKISFWMQDPPKFPKREVQKLVSPPGEGKDRLKKLVMELINR